MPAYANLGGDSGVASYELSDGCIDVEFTTGAVYRYTDASAGAANIRQMHALARAGHGLNAFINTTVKHAYAAKIR